MIDNILGVYSKLPSVACTFKFCSSAGDDNDAKRKILKRSRDMHIYLYYEISKKKKKRTVLIMFYLSFYFLKLFLGLNDENFRKEKK